ncbi:YceI family protein [Hymenobacter chitinivorans]|uniref:Polyisoprenoid-binding protein YceI n=1 Tax=Hymenobacter chitinivorans DSM 11115 TaxID=1121954 RepID=A0A2M9AQV0_9BACT|nr:YceI family protein [Hymenobacter chitinivorans]PJJ48070.1 polyisoprenoid-binding protein YceI [Hymenobacter chitinivorans DSM 11115]
MKTLFFFLLLFSCLAFRPAPVVYRVDTAASKLTWTGYAEVGSWAPSGTVQLRQGQLEYGGNTLRNGRFEIDMRTIAHPNPDLQNHLRGTDFFAVEQFPTAVFELREVVGTEAVGQLTVKGITRPLRFPVRITRAGGTLRVQGTASVDRTQFGVQFNSSSFFQNLGDHAIRNDFQLAFDMVAATGLAKQ